MNSAILPAYSIPSTRARLAQTNRTAAAAAAIDERFMAIGSDGAAAATTSSREANLSCALRRLAAASAGEFCPSFLPATERKKANQNQ